MFLEVSYIKSKAIITKNKNMWSECKEKSKSLKG